MASGTQLPLSWLFVVCVFLGVGKDWDGREMGEGEGDGEGDGDGKQLNAFETRTKGHMQSCGIFFHTPLLTHL